MITSALTLHDTSDFPIVRFLSDLAVAGYGADWGRDMDALVDAKTPFVLIYPRFDANEDHEDRKLRGVWLKQNKERLAGTCLALIVVEPDATRRAELEAMFPNLVRAFGTPQASAASLVVAFTLLFQFRKCHASVKFSR